MVSYYNSAAMYRHQQAVTAQNAQFSGSPMHSWYAPGGYHPQGPQVGATAATYNCMEEQQMWHHPSAHGAHSVFNHEFPDFMTHGAMSLQQHHQQQQQQQQPAAVQMEHESQLPSPPITVSGSELSSPGASGNISPPNSVQTRPPPARSPFEWIKKTSYQCQPTPGRTRTKDKYRVVYTDFQRIELEKEFNLHNKYITIRRKTELATNLGLSERQIKIWFQNRRAKERKQLKKTIEEKNIKGDPESIAQLHDYEVRMHQLQQQVQNRMLQKVAMGSMLSPRPMSFLYHNYDGEPST